MRIKKRISKYPREKFYHRLIKELKPFVQGIHIMPIGWDKKVPLVLEASGL